MKKYKVFETISCPECNGKGNIFHPLWELLESEEIEYPETRRELEDLFIENGYAFPDTEAVGNGELRSIVTLPEKFSQCRNCNGKAEIDVLVKSIDELPELPSIYGSFDTVIDRNKQGMFALVGNPQYNTNTRQFDDFKFHILDDSGKAIFATPNFEYIEIPLWVAKQILADNDDFIWLEFGEYRIFHNDIIITICDNGDVSIGYINDSDNDYHLKLPLSIVSRLYFFESTQAKLNKKAIKEVTSKSVKNKTKTYVFDDITVEFFDTGYLFITDTQTKKLALSASFDPVLFWGALADNPIFPLLEFDEFFIDSLHLRAISMGISSNGNVYMRDDIQFVLPRYVVSQMYYYCFLFGNFLFGA